MIRIETRSKPPSGPSDQPPKQRRPVDGDGRGGRGTGPAIVAGALVGLVAIGLISVYVVTQRQAEPTVVPFGAPAAVATVAPAAAALAGVPALNGDFARTDIIAYVNGEPYTMGQLEVAVRVAKTLAAISKDPVPDFGAPEMRDFQIRLLRREIDSMLLRQALARTGTPVPPVDVQPVIDGYLKQYNGTPEQLAAALTAAGIGQRELLAWLSRGATPSSTCRPSSCRAARPKNARLC
jgi:hypothetical protein